MRTFVLYAGPFGEQIINAISTGGYAGEIVGVYELRPEPLIQAFGGDPGVLREIWEDPSRFVPQDLPPTRAELLLIAGIHGKLADLVVPIARMLGVKRVIYGIDDRDSAPEARKSISDDLKSNGIVVEFPEPLCSLESPECEISGSFTTLFGKPQFRIKVDEGRRIAEIELVRDTPCGSASAACARLIGFSIADPVALAIRCYELHHDESAEHYCLAEMDPLHPLMQEAGDLLKDAVFEACGLATTKQMMEREITEARGLSRESLRDRVVSPTVKSDRGMIGCTSFRSFDRYLGELITAGRICSTEDGFLHPPEGDQQLSGDGKSSSITNRS